MSDPELDKGEGQLVPPLAIATDSAASKGHDPSAQGVTLGLGSRRSMAQAQGHALGVRHSRVFQALKGRHSIRTSVPHVPFVLGNAVPVKELPKLILKHEPSMMMLLLLDVTNHRRHVRLAYRECTVASLPGKAASGRCPIGVNLCGGAYADYAEGVTKHSPGLPRSGYPGKGKQFLVYPEGVAQNAGPCAIEAAGRNPFRVEHCSGDSPQGSREKMRQPWAMLHNAFGVGRKACRASDACAPLHPEGVAQQSPGLALSAYPGTVRATTSDG